MKTFISTIAGLALACGMLPAAEKGLERGMMHCFAFTPIATATAEQWDAFYKATDQWPDKYKGIKRVWHGKLRAPLNQYSTDAATRKKVMAGEKDVAGPVNYVKREQGVCMEFTDAAALDQYTKSPFHKEWMAAYEKVRVAGTTTYDILPH